MKKIDSNEMKLDRSNGSFWQKQFQKEATKKQKVFDWIFGVVLPVICFSADPAIFKTSELWGSDAYLAVLKPFAYLLSFVSIMALMAALIWGGKLKSLNGPLAGLFLIGGVISLGIGIVMLPISLLGLAIFIGVLGFTPLITAAVYLRNASRSLNCAKPFFASDVLARSVVFTGLFSLITPAVINLEIDHAIKRMANGNSATIRQEAQLLYFVSPIVNADSLRREFRNESDQARKKALSDAYEKLTGANIERHNRSAFD